MLKRVLLIDDDPIFTERFRLAIGTAVDLHVLSVAECVLPTCSDWAPDLIVLDVLLAPGDPFKVLDDLGARQMALQPAILCLTRGAGAATRLQRFGGVVFGALKREIDPDDLRSTIADALGLESDTLDPVAA